MLTCIVIIWYVHKSNSNTTVINNENGVRKSKDGGGRWWQGEGNEKKQDTSLHGPCP